MAAVTAAVRVWTPSLAKMTRDMMLNRAHTDEEGSGDGRVGLPRDEQPQDVIFTWGQRYALGAGGWLERGERLSDCLRRGKRPASGPRGRERFFAESGAGGSHGLLQRCLVFPHSISQPEPVALRPGRAQQPGGAFRLPGGGHDPHGLDHLGDEACSGMIPAQFQRFAIQR